MASVTVTLTGFKDLEQRIASLGAQTPQTVATALYEEAQSIIADAVTNYVPYDQGVLAASGRVETPQGDGRSISVTFGFGGPAAPYAIAVHENPRAGKTGGTSPKGRQYLTWARRGGWKYLENPLKTHAPELADGLRQALNDLAEHQADSRRAKELAYATGF